MDKALIYEYEKNVHTRICYVSSRETTPDDWVFQEGEVSVKDSWKLVLSDGVAEFRNCLISSKSQNKIVYQLSFEASLFNPSPSFVSVPHCQLDHELSNQDER